MQLQFSNKVVTYETFINDVASRVATLMKADERDPDFVSQTKAFRIFGRGNIERWRRQGKVEPCKRPGKLEYPMARLRELQRTVQDYFD